jgi:oxygen-dependent protoporphyrinogen oxidase
VTAPRRPVIAVVGGGIAGLSAAWELVTSSDIATGAGPPIVHVLEAGNRVGGKLDSAEFAGRTVDLAADAFLARRPEATELCEQIGVRDELVPVGTTGASILARGRLRPMPSALNLGVPTRWWPLARSGLLSPGESLRVTKDLVMPHLGAAPVSGDRSVADIIGERLGRPVVERLVDPLIGGINAGGVDELSAAATFPALIAASHQTGSLMRSLGRLPRPAGSAPVFWSLRQGTASLVDRLVDKLVNPRSAWDVSIHTGVSVDAITQASGNPSGGNPSGGNPSGGNPSGGNPSGGGTWRLTLGGINAAGITGNGEGALAVDGIVLALPAQPASVLLAVHSPMAAGLLSAIDYSSVGVVTLAVQPDAINRRLDGTGFLVPRTSPIGGRPALMTGCTYLSRKWPHLASAGTELIRVSVGRYGDERHTQLDDDELTAAAFGELAQVLDIHGGFSDSRVTRWSGAFPQYRVGHLIRVAKIEEAVAALPGMAVAGSAYRGVGIPACVGSGRSAARTVLASLGESSR